MRIWKIIMIMSLLCTVSISSFGCASKSDEARLLENQVVTVQRGNLTVDITAAGNLALSRTEDLAFEMAGTVEEVLVEEGDSVEEGQVLAKLDTSEWEDEITTLERALLQAEINLRNAEVALETAQDTYTWPQLLVAQADLDEAEDGFEWILDREGDYENDRRLWERLAASAERNLIRAKATLEAMLSGADTDEVAIKKRQVELAQHQLEDAEEALDDARSASPEITAPFDGFITKVNVEGGDEVKTGTVAVQLADATRFEADILVSEMDIYQVKLGGNATVQIDAMSTLTLPAKVTHISPTATIQSGVVNYKVKVEIQSLEAVIQERQEARQKEMQELSSGELPERLQQAVEEGSITQEQAEEMMKQRQQGQGEQQESQPWLMPTMIPEDFQLREGLTVTVSIIVDERTDVLLVPNAAITTQGRQTFVQVLAADGTLEQRAIQTGISDWQFTEVIDGLSEGERVVIPETTTTTPTPQQQAPPGGMRIPGMPRIR